MIAAIKHVFISGITSGIGHACMTEALSRGWLVSGCGRNQKKLDELNALHPESVCALQADVCDLKSMRFVLDTVVERFGPLRACVANAGRGVDGELLELDADDIAAVFNVNVLGVHRTIQSAKRYLSPGTSIVVVASVASFLSIPRMGAYCATKHALDAYVGALRMELADENIAVMSMCPGTVSTNFFQAAPKPGTVWDWRPGKSLKPEQVAKRIIDQAQFRGPRRCVMPWFAHFAALVYRFCPSIAEGVMRRALRKMRLRDSSSS
ncbi:MAG: SDR family NAD(P)-dependent oxidoreductase [Planctomycetes bacterium]|nr:SDR family NAD(P)-dependent oxidoreductase [Planctomycetota bacterium]